MRLETGEIRLYLGLYLLPWLLMVIFAPQWIKAEDPRLRPVIVSSTVKSSGLNHSVLLCWEVNKEVHSKIRNYYIYCNCSDYKMDMIRVYSWRRCHQFSMMVDTCFDTCHCFVYAQPRYLSASIIYWSNGHDFRLGPTAPRAPPLISLPVVRINAMTSIQVYLKLPALNDSYCDVDTVRGATVIITTEHNASHEFHISGQEITKARNQYMFTLPLGGTYFWNKMNIAVSVNNSVGAAPMTSSFPVRGAINSDITPGSYQLHNDNITNVSASFHWWLAYIPQNMLEGGFISGFYYDVELLNGTDVHVCEKCDSSFTITSLIPGQWYLLTAGLNTTDNSSWAPESRRIAFKTNQDADSSKAMSHQQDNKELIAWCIGAVFGSIIIIAVILAFCLKPYCSKSERYQERRSFQEGFSMHGLSHIPSIPRRTNSDVESISVTSSESNDSISAGDYIQIRSNHSVHNSYS